MKAMRWLVLGQVILALPFSLWIRWQQSHWVDSLWPLVTGVAVQAVWIVTACLWLGRRAEAADRAQKRR